MAHELNDPAKFTGQLNELSSLVRLSKGSQAVHNYRVSDEQELSRVFKVSVGNDYDDIQVLSVQQDGLEELNQTVRSDTRDMETMLSVINKDQQNRDSTM